MTTLLEALRNILGEADFYKQMSNTSNYSWDYGAMLEYFIAGMLLLIVVSFVFKMLLKWFH